MNDILTRSDFASYFGSFLNWFPDIMEDLYSIHFFAVGAAILIAGFVIYLLRRVFFN